MKKEIRLDFKATLKRFLPDTGEFYTVEPGIRIRELMEQLAIPESEVNIIFIDGVLGNLDSVIQGGERVALFPPMGGG